MKQRSISVVYHFNNEAFMHLSCLLHDWLMRILHMSVYVCRYVCVSYLHIHEHVYLIINIKYLNFLSI